MKTISNYQIAKQTLKNASIEYKRFIKNDKPLIRMNINDDIDYLIKDLNLSDYQINLLSTVIRCFACYNYIMRMTFTYTCTRNFNEFCFL